MNAIKKAADNIIGGAIIGGLVGLVGLGICLLTTIGSASLLDSMEGPIPATLFGIGYLGGYFYYLFCFLGVILGAIVGIVWNIISKEEEKDYQDEKEL